MILPVSAAHPIEGVWLPVKAEFDGVAAPELVVARTEFTVSAGAYKVRFAGEIHDHGRYELASTAEEETHLRIILTSTHRETHGRILASIYQLTGNRLRICYGLDGVTPDAFATMLDSRRYLVTYRRSSP